MIFKQLLPKLYEAINGKKFMYFLQRSTTVILFVIDMDTIYSHNTNFSRMIPHLLALLMLLL